MREFIIGEEIYTGTVLLNTYAPIEDLQIFEVVW